MLSEVIASTDAPDQLSIVRRLEVTHLDGPGRLTSGRFARKYVFEELVGSLRFKTDDGVVEVTGEAIVLRHRAFRSSSSCRCNAACA